MTLFLFTSGVWGQVASGGSYTLNQAVIAGGGGTSNDTVNNNYKLEGTIGQPAAGISALGGTYGARSGFWAANPLAPTAAGATIGGRVLGLRGESLQNVTVTLSGGTLLVPRTAHSSSFGYFKFEDVEVGQIYILTISSRRYGFGQNPRIISLLDNVTDVILQAEWEN